MLEGSIAHKWSQRQNHKRIEQKSTISYVNHAQFVKRLSFFLSHRVWIFYQSKMTNSFFNPHFHWYHKSFYTKLESCQKPFSLYRAWDWKKLYRPQLCFIIYAHRIAFAVEFFVWVELSVSQSAHISIFHTFITPE